MDILPQLPSGITGPILGTHRETSDTFLFAKKKSSGAVWIFKLVNRKWVPLRSMNEEEEKSYYSNPRLELVVYNRSVEIERKTS